MKPKQSLEDKLDALERLGDGTSDANAAAKELRHALAGAGNILAAKAAQVTAKCSCAALIPDLVNAFDRFMENPVKTDKGCMAKTAIAEALNELSYDREDIFLRGIRHVQMEPSFGPPVDTADGLRGHCAFGLVRIGYPNALFELAELLMDRQTVARRAAIKAIGAVGGEAVELMLRMKVLGGDQEADILGECFSALMAVNPERSISFVAQYLESPNPWISEEAALALGESRTEKAFEILRAHWENNPMASVRKTLLLPIALLRIDAAFEFLIAVIQDGHQELAVAAIQAAKICATDEERINEVGRAVALRKEPAVRAAYEKEFGVG
ncbi:MAG: hypothetical protein NTX50_17090 [Candidatus Sumerlaeota bacterium]|nr:hypothetical protein [Candidatus Sumerlaeota bacterium]